MRPPFSAGFKVVQNLDFSVAESATLINNLADSEKDGQAFKKA